MSLFAQSKDLGPLSPEQFARLAIKEGNSSKSFPQIDVRIRAELEALERGSTPSDLELIQQELLPYSGRSVANVIYWPQATWAKNTEAIDLIIKALEARGINSKRAQANILAQVQEESRFQLKAENGNYREDELTKTFPSYFNVEKAKIAVSVPRDAEKTAKLFELSKPKGVMEDYWRLVKDVPKDQFIFGVTYGGRFKNGLGVHAGNDGFKFRGRGYIQLTFKENYEKASVALGRWNNKYSGKTSLMNVPSHALDPKVAAALVPIYFLDVKSASLDALEDCDKVTDLVGPVETENKKPIRAAIAQSFYKQLIFPRTKQPKPGDLVRISRNGFNSIALIFLCNAEIIEDQKVERHKYLRKTNVSIFWGRQYIQTRKEAKCELNSFPPRLTKTMINNIEELRATTVTSSHRLPLLFRNTAVKGLPSFLVTRISDETLRVPTIGGLYLNLRGLDKTKVEVFRKTSK